MVFEESIFIESKHRLFQLWKSEVLIDEILIGPKISYTICSITIWLSCICQINVKVFYWLSTESKKDYL